MADVGDLRNRELASVGSLCDRWQRYHRAFQGDETAGFEASRESVVQAYIDWVDAYQRVVRQPEEDAFLGACRLREIGVSTLHTKERDQ